MIHTNNQQHLQQEVISDNRAIFNRIRSEILTAKSEVLIASTWFTDDELFETLLQKSSEVAVDIIIGDNEENNKLNFDELARSGGKYVKVKNVGYGMMHQKFCVIDRKVAIHGSYNYTNNAKRNNHESVILTNHLQTIQSLVDNFLSIKAKAVSSDNMETTPLAPTARANITAAEQTKYQMDYEEILNTLINTELNVFDRKELAASGFERAKICNGDSNMLPNALDTLYYTFKEDIDLDIEHQVRLSNKIEERCTSQLKMAEIEHEQILNTAKIEAETTRLTTSNEIEEKKYQIQALELKIEDIIKNDVAQTKSTIQTHRNKINELNLAFVKPNFPWHDMIPLGLIALVLFSYLILFYSSAAYILLFSVGDAEAAMNAGNQLPPHHIFEPKAIPLALNHGGSSIFFILLFVGVPIAFALADRYVANKVMKFFISYVLGIVAVDTFVAYTIAKSLHDLKTLTGETTAQWAPADVIKDANFYLVFLMGAAALLVFKFIFAKIMSVIESRHSGVQAQKNKVEIKQIEEKITELNNRIFGFEKQIEICKLETIQVTQNKSTLQAQLENLPVRSAMIAQRQIADHSLKVEYIKQITQIYKNRVEQNNPSISLDALRDRINIFFEGWTAFLHQFYAVSLAVEKSVEASREVTNWFDSKIKTL